jgi:hypothetical protein
MRTASKQIASALTVLVVAGCHARSQPPVAASTSLSLTSAQEQACRGSSFDADDAPALCLHHGAGDTAPPADRLKVTLVSPPTVRSGYDAGLVVEMKNVSNEPLPLDVDDSCGTFEAVASNDKTTSFETDCFGMCAGGPEPHVLRVTLEPGGVVRKKVKFFAVETRVIMDAHDECVERTTGGLPPGTYDLHITLPWTDPVPEDPAVLRPRVLEAQLAVTP